MNSRAFCVIIVALGCRTRWNEIHRTKEFNPFCFEFLLNPNKTGCPRKNSKRRTRLLTLIIHALSFGHYFPRIFMLLTLTPCPTPATPDGEHIIGILQKTSLPVCPNLDSVLKREYFFFFRASRLRVFCAVVIIRTSVFFRC